MNRLMRSLMNGIEGGTAVGLDYPDLKREDIDEIRKMVEQIGKNRQKDRAPAEGISDSQIERLGKYIITFGAVSNAYVREQIGRGNAEATVKHYQQSIKKIKKFLYWHDDTEGIYDTLTDDERIARGAKIPIGTLEGSGIEADLREFMTHVEHNGEITTATLLRSFRAIAYWMMENRLIEHRHITVKTVQTDIKEVYTTEELNKLLKRPDDRCSFTEYRNWVIINYLLATGNRIGTIINLKISDIDFDEDMITINTQKNKRKSRIPLQSTKLKKILLEYIQDWLTDENGHTITPYLFPSSYSDSANKPMTREKMSKSIADYNRRRGVTKTSVHLFRHTFTKNWIMTGGDLHMLQKVLGHSTLAMVTHYANLYDVDLKEGIEEHSVLSTIDNKNRGKMIKKRT